MVHPEKVGIEAKKKEDGIWQLFFSTVYSAVCMESDICADRECGSRYLYSYIRQRLRESHQIKWSAIKNIPNTSVRVYDGNWESYTGRPILITIPLTAAVVGFMITSSYLNPREFLAKVPMIPIVLFMLAIFGFVALAYYIGGRKIMHCSLVEALRSDYMI